MYLGNRVDKRFDELTKDREKAREFYFKNWASIFLVDEDADTDDVIIAELAFKIIGWLIETADIENVASDYDWGSNPNLITIEKYRTRMIQFIKAGEIGYDVSIDKRLIVVE
jgi:hypothetical protein